MQTSRREAPRGAPLNTFELHLCLLGMDVLGLACGYASVYSRIWVSPLSSSSHPTLEVLCRDPFSEGHLWPVVYITYIPLQRLFSNTFNLSMRA